MASISRYVKMTAKPGQGEALAARMLEVANGLRDTPGCDLYLVNRAAGDGDTIWITELWRSQESADAALQTPGAAESIAAVRELLAEGGFERLDLEPLGGTGTLEGEKGFAIVNLNEVEDLAPGFGYGEMGEARFARGVLDAVTLGISLQRLRPGVRQAFGHRHVRDEELYVILRGTGRVAIDQEVREVRELDAIRVAPGSTRALEAGPDGLDFLAMGAHHAGDPEIAPGFWPG